MEFSFPPPLRASEGAAEAEADRRPPRTPRNLVSAALVSRTAGQWLWTWVERCGPGDARCVAMFDKHGVADTLSHAEAGDVGVYLDHLSDDEAYMPLLLCSRGIGRAYTAF